MNNQNPFGEIIYAYTRAQAVADGYQVDVTKTAQEAGIKLPMFLNPAARGMASGLNHPLALALTLRALSAGRKGKCWRAGRENGSQRRGCSGMVWP